MHVAKNHVNLKVGIPGEKYLGKDHEGWEYTSHDLWKKVGCKIYFKFKDVI